MFFAVVAGSLLAVVAGSLLAVVAGSLLVWWRVVAAVLRYSGTVTVLFRSQYRSDHSVKGHTQYQARGMICIRLEGDQAPRRIAIIMLGSGM